MLFDKKVVLITGAAGGLGRAVVRAFAEQGALLALTDTHRERLALLRSELGLSPERCHIHQADLSHLDQATAFAHATEQALSRIDIVVHIAGGFRMGDVHETSRFALSGIRILGRPLGKFGWRLILECPVRAILIILSPPSLNALLGFMKRFEPAHIETFPPDRRVEGFHISVVRGLFGS